MRPTALAAALTLAACAHAPAPDPAPVARADGRAAWRLARFVFEVPAGWTVRAVRGEISAFAAAPCADAAPAGTCPSLRVRAARAAAGGCPPAEALRAPDPDPMADDVETLAVALGGEPATLQRLRVGEARAWRYAACVGGDAYEIALSGPSGSEELVEANRRFVASAAFLAAP